LVKVGVVGAGRVGSTAAYTLLMLMDLDEIALVDVLGELAEGEALDLTHAAHALGKRTRIIGGSDYGLLRGSSLIIVAAGAARKPGMSRLDLLAANAETMRHIAAGLRGARRDASGASSAARAMTWSWESTVIACSSAASIGISRKCSGARRWR